METPYNTNLFKAVVSVSISAPNWWAYCILMKMTKRHSHFLSFWDWSIRTDFKWKTRKSR
jgi:hypothetical protein